MHAHGDPHGQLCTAVIMWPSGSLPSHIACCMPQVQASKDCVQKTITRMEQKLTGASSANKRALSAVIFLLRASNPVVQQRAAMSLARLAPEDQLKTIFIDKAGVDVLLEVLTDPKVSMHVHREAANALLQLTKKLDNTLPGESCLVIYGYPTSR